MSRSRGWSVSVAALVVCVGVASAARAATCDPAYVQVKNKQIVVLPTEAEDTANLQCAIDLAATKGPGAVVQLSAGTFHTAQLVIEGLRGAIRGMGETRTIVQNLDEPLPIDRPCMVGGLCFNQAPPSATNRYPTLVSVIGKDVALSDMTFEIAGPASTDVWNFPIFGFPVAGFSEVVQLIGSNASLDASRLTFRGEYLAWDGSAYAGGTAGGILVWSFANPWHVVNSTLVVTDSTFLVGGVFAYNLDRSRVTVSGNLFLADSGTFAVSDARDSDVAFTHNAMAAQTGTLFSGIYLWPGNLGTGIARTRLFLANNTISGDAGILIVPGSFSDVSCLAVNNDMSQTTTPYAWDNTSTPCKVVGKR